MTHDVFISHSTMDKQTAEAVCTALEAQGLRCWIAPRDIAAGKDWGAAIIQAIKSARVMVLVFSANANNSHPVKCEIERAHNKGIPIIQFRVENLLPSESLEFFLSTRQWLNAFPPPMELHLQHLGRVVCRTIEESARDDAIKKVRNAKSDEEKTQAKARAEKNFGSATIIPAVTQNSKGERRQVTVLFVGILNSAALYEQIDSEEAAMLIADCLKELAGVVYEHGGIVDKSTGGNVMAVFGAPVTLEDDAESALRAALSIKESLQSISRHCREKTGKALDFHIGINTGEVISGTASIDSPAGFAVLGDTVNVASDLQNAAEAGQILIGQKTFQMTRGIFTFQEPRSIKVNGRAAPLFAHELVHAKMQPSKQRGLEGLAPTFVGREREHQTLRKALNELKKGSGQIVTVIGEAGVGKSRLISEIRQNSSEELIWLEGHCFAYSRALSYGPFLDLLRRFADIADEDGEIEVRANLRSRMEKMFPQDLRMYAIFAHLLSMRLESDEASLIGKMSGEIFRRELFAAMEKFLTGLAAEKPVVVVLEDLHWADQSSIDLASHLCSLTACAPVAIIALFRSREEGSDNWEKFAPAIEGFRDRYSELSLQPLSGDLSRDLVGGLLNGSALSQKFYDVVIDKAEGNPFFVEELLRSLMERGILVRDGTAWKITELAETIQVPDTLQGILLSRLDRLPEQTKRVIQKAAVIGRVFLYRILKHMAGEEGELEAQMALIEDAELVRERSRLPEIEYMFRHALTQEVAYKTLLLPARKMLHQSVGQAMEAVFAERIEEFTGLLAYHYFSGEVWEKAMEFSASAADYASALYAYAESREHYWRALESLKHLPDSEANRRKKVDLILSLVSVSLQAVAPEQNLTRLAEAEKLVRQEQNRLRLARVQLWIGRVYYLAGKTKEAIGYFQQILPVASNDADLLSLPGAVIGRAFFMQGHFAKAQQILEQTIPLLEAAKNHRELLFAHIYRGGARTAMGDFAGGSADITSALKMARAARNQNAETMAQTGFALIKLIAGRHAEAMVHAREALLVAEKSGDAMFRYSSNAFMAWGLTGIGDWAKALAHWTAAHEAAKTLGGHLLLGDWLTAMEAETFCEQKNWAAATEKAQQAIAMAKSTGSVIAEGLAERIAGRVEGGQSRWPEAEEHLAKSAALLQTINAKFDLARTLLCQGKVAVAKENNEAAANFFRQAIELASSCGLQREEKAARSLMADLQASN